jgi:hypothetical protein
MRFSAATSTLPRKDEPSKRCAARSLAGLQESQLQKNLPDLQSLNITDTDSQRDEMLTHLASTLKSFMLTCQEWKFTRGELFQRTKELGSTKQYAKNLLECWGDWLRADSIEEEEEEEEEERKKAEKN